MTSMTTRRTAHGADTRGGEETVLAADHPHRELEEPRPGANGSGPRVLEALVGLGALNAAAVGLMYPAMYDGVVPLAVRAGAFGQDVVSVLAGAVLVALSLLFRRGPRTACVATGLVAYLTYANGVLTLERVVNPLYLLYLAVFAGGAWTLLLTVRSPAAPIPPASGVLRGAGAAVALLQPLTFVPLWVSALVPMMASRRSSSPTFSVFVLDLGFVMPAFALAAILLLRRRAAGTRLAAALFVMGAALMTSLAAAALSAPFLGIAPALGEWLPAAVLALVFLAAAVPMLVAVRPAVPAPFTSRSTA